MAGACPGVWWEPTPRSSPAASKCALALLLRVAVLPTLQHGFADCRVTDEYRVPPVF